MTDRVGTAVHHRSRHAFMRTPVPSPNVPHELSFGCWCGPQLSKVVSRNPWAHTQWDRPHFMPDGTTLWLV